jgi:ribokinase
MQKNRVLLVGSANMDFSMNVYKIPAVGETIIDDGGVAYTPGGKGGNAAVALAKLGADCVFYTKLGKDAHGQKLYNYYCDMGVNTSAIKVDRDHPTGLAVVIREGDGNNRIIVYPGANSFVNTDGVLEAFESSPEALYLNFEIPFEIARSAAKIAAERGIPIFVDAAPASDGVELDTLPPIEIFSPNETETEKYTGISPVGTENSIRAALALYRTVKCKYVVIKQGARGAFLYDGKKYATFPAVRPDKVVDTTGAGDAFTAALTVEYMRCGDIHRAINFANCAGAIAVSRVGASSAVPTYSEVLELYSKTKFY